ncbi:hypothetical protein [Crossiella cryophila]|uniref:hypothetical protein n=1 Tax=Crossiella cryophila TaxID=43355 RepID=UPI0031EFA4B6
MRGNSSRQRAAAVPVRRSSSTSTAGPVPGRSAGSRCAVHQGAWARAAVISAVAPEPGPPVSHSVPPRPPASARSRAASAACSAARPTNPAAPARWASRVSCNARSPGPGSMPSASTSRALVRW